MFYKASKTVLYATMGLALASMGSAAMADVLVTRSSGAAARQYPRGTRLADDQVIVLGRGDSVTLLTSRGTRRYSRPGRYPLAGPRLIASNGIGSGSRGIARAGAIRTGSETHDGLTTWQIDVSMSGPFCIAEGQAVSFWRLNTDSPETVTITRIADNGSAAARFSQGEFLAAWPSGFVPHNGTYRLESTAGGDPREIVITSLAVDLNDAVAVGSALLENGCDDQLSAYTAAIEASEDES